MLFVFGSFLVTAMLGIANLFWGYALTQQTPRLHLGLLSTMLSIALAVTIILTKRNGTKVLTTTLASLMVLAFTIVLGSYDHGLKLVLTLHGLPPQMLATILPPSWGSIGPWDYEVEGLLLIPAGVVALIALVRWWRPRGEA